MYFIWKNLTELRYIIVPLISFKRKTLKVPHTHTFPEKLHTKGTTDESLRISGRGIV